jgi:hypothetical protein
MSDTLDIKCLTYTIGTTATAAGTVPIMYIPAAYGAITLLSANLCPLVAAGTVPTLQIAKLTNAATPVMAASGTLGTLPAAAGTLTAGVLGSITLATTLVSPGTAGCWLGMVITGTIIAHTMLSINYTQGRDQ